MRTGSKNTGFVLVTVLWVVAILTVITLGFGRRALLERSVATYTLDHAKAAQMARAAVARGMVELQNKSVYDALSMLPERTSYAQQWSRPRNLLASDGEGGEGGAEAEPKYFAESGNKDFKDELCAYIIRDEESRISLSTSPDELLDEVPGLSRTMIRKINVRRKGDADANEPAQPFQIIEELRFMDDIDDDEWFGTDEKPGLCDLLTCFGDGKVNINTATEVVLNCIPKVAGVAGAITAYRAGDDGELFTEDDKDFASLQEVGEKLNISGAAMEKMNLYCKVSSQYFTITGTATRRNGKIRATCSATVDISAVSATGPAPVVKWREEFLEP